MKFEMPILPYAPNALEPAISKTTIDLHYGKHLQTYVNNLNNLIQGTAFENATLEDICKKADGAIFNNGAQVWNHTFYFNTFSPKGNTVPTGVLEEAINKAFGSFENFQKEFNAASVGLFGSGWAWLSKDKEGKLVITKESNAGNPLKSGLTPLLCFDVWEHAYYVDYQNRRADHLNAVWSIIDWKVVEERFVK
ncbi:MAG: superoxide dismutase [Dysgonamonadaceae bacterium]|jgi:Fe-Mn family superoxide dismutase|nr:superoxide dismutase [Dysgonamonadaceae bacterium]